MQCRIPGSESFQLRHLVFATIEQEKGRLFGISFRGALFEVDLKRLCPKNIRDSYGGAAWCLAASVRNPVLAVGCEDGAARLYTYENGSLEYSKSFATTGSRVLSIGFHPKLTQLFYGCADGVIRCIDETSGKSLFRLTGDIHRGLSTHIWSLLVLSDSTVVSGDSRGRIQFWDGMTGVLMSSLHQHTADILCIAADRDETQIFASGIDAKVVCVKRISATFRLPSEISDDISRQSPAHSQWVYTTAHRPHTHDVHALAVCPCSTTTYNSGERSVSTQESLVSGGIDSKICIYSISDFMKSRPSWVLPTPARGLVSSSSDHRMVAVKHDQYINIWKLDTMNESHSDVAASPGVLLDGRLEVSDFAFVHSISLSPAGNCIALSSNSGTRLYSISNPGASSGKHYFKRMDVPIELSRCLCQAMCFSPDGKTFAAVYNSSSSGSTVVTLRIDISEPSGNSRKKRKVEKNKTVEADEKENIAVASLIDLIRHNTSVREGLNPVRDQISSAGSLSDTLEFVCSVCSFSADSKWLALASANCRVYVYEVDG